MEVAGSKGAWAPPAHDGGAAVALDGLSVQAGARPLLERVSAEFRAGDVTLIVGPSGAGKSVLLRLIAGLISPGGSLRWNGTIRIGGRRAERGGRARRPTVGVVFQQYALFDEWSPLANVRFGRQHRVPREAGAPASALEPQKLLDELQLPSHVRTAHLSGGQKQRLALARTLAYDPDVILYDEPTSGLDAATARRVADLIRETHDRHPTTSIVVTHDYEILPTIADRVYLLDATAHTLREVPREEWGQLSDRLTAAAPRAAAGPRAKGSGGWRSGWAWLFGKLTGILEGSGGLVEQLVAAPLRLLPLWRSPAAGVRYLLHYLRLVAGPTAWVYIALAGMIIGFVATYFTFEHLPFREITEPLLLEELLQSLGFALYRILVPVLATILIAARCGAAVASDIGNKVYGQQIDALRTFGVRPDAYLLTGVLYAFLIGSPLLTGLGFLVSRWTSLVVFTAMRPGMGAFFWDTHFHRQLAIPGHWLLEGTGWLLAKVLVCGLGTAWICYSIASRPKNSAPDVSHGITSSILWSTLFVLVVHFAFAFWEF